MFELTPLVECQYIADDSKTEERAIRPKGGTLSARGCSNNLPVDHLFAAEQWAPHFAPEKSMLIIGERLNSSRRVVLDALRRRDEDYLLKEARAQQDAGAHYIDLNAALVGDEIETLRWAVPLLQRELNVSLSIDSTNPPAIDAALDLHDGTAIVNSITGRGGASRAPPSPNHNVQAHCDSPLHG